MKKFGSAVILVFLSIVLAISYAQAGQSPLPLGKKVIKVGGQGALSGAQADYGRQMIMGATLAIEEINASGGILGSKLEMKFLDSQLSPAVGVKNARYLLTDWGADFLFGIDSSAVANALFPVVTEAHKLLFLVHASTLKANEELTYRAGHKEVFRTCTPFYHDAYPPAIFFAGRPEIKRWACLGCDYEYGYATWDMFKYKMRELRPDVEFVGEAWAGFNTMDFTKQLTSLAAKKPNAIFATPWGGEGVMMLRQAQLLGLFNDPDFHVWWQAMLGVDLLEGTTADVMKDKFRGKLWGTARWIWNWPDTPENKAFVNKFKDRFARYPNYSATNSYIAVYTFKYAVEKTRSLETSKLVKVLEGAKIPTPDGGRWIRPEDHQMCYNVPLGRVKYDLSVSPIPFLSDLNVVPWETYFHKPPFPPVPKVK